MVAVWKYLAKQLNQNRKLMEAEDWAERTIAKDSSVATLAESDRDIAERRHLARLQKKELRRANGSKKRLLTTHEVVEASSRGLFSSKSLHNFLTNGKEICEGDEDDEGENSRQSSARSGLFRSISTGKASLTDMLTTSACSLKSLGSAAGASGRGLLASGRGLINSKSWQSLHDKEEHEGGGNSASVKQGGLLKGLSTGKESLMEKSARSIKKSGLLKSLSTGKALMEKSGLFRSASGKASPTGNSARNIKQTGLLKSLSTGKDDLADKCRSGTKQSRLVRGVSMGKRSLADKSTLDHPKQSRLVRGMSMGKGSLMENRTRNVGLLRGMSMGKGGVMKQSTRSTKQGALLRGASKGKTSLMGMVTNSKRSIRSLGSRVIVADSRRSPTVAVTTTAAIATENEKQPDET
jgi:hypothetical protein